MFYNELSHDFFLIYKIILNHMLLKHASVGLETEFLSGSQIEKRRLFKGTGPG